MKTIIVLVALLVAAVLPRSFARELTRDCDSYRCPPNSFVKDGVKCLDSFRDCRCKDGYKPFNRTCVPCPFKEVCKDVCKIIKVPICRPVCEKVCEGKICKQVCKKKCEFVEKKHCTKVCTRRRVCDCDFKCPPYSKPRPGTQCLDTIGDCKCHRDYRMVFGRCVPKCDYECPKHSRFIGDRDDCPDNFDHCKCRDGYEKKHGRCVECEERCIPKCQTVKGKKVCRDICFKKCEPQFVCPFKCPVYSFQITRARCARHMGDCRCKKGYVAKGDKCVLR